ncbi:unnamed protein product [Closterium sp. Yama58-4]|nr:unnamed protein product [Closterium sp. Yama58-4]
MRSKVPLGKSSPRPHEQVNNYGRINSPGDDIRVAMAKNASKAGGPTAASGVSCPADIEEDEWWNQPVGSDDEVEERRAGDSDNDGGDEADGDNAEAQEAAVDANERADEAEAELETVAPADADAVAEADKVAADAVLFDGEGSDDDPWSLGTDDDVPILKRRLRHRL